MPDTVTAEIKCYPALDGKAGRCLTQFDTHKFFRFEWSSRSQAHRDRARVVQQARALLCDDASYAEQEVDGIQFDDVAKRRIKPGGESATFDKTDTLTNCAFSDVGVSDLAILNAMRCLAGNN